jgi:hypothetical protein
MSTEELLWALRLYYQEHQASDSEEYLTVMDLLLEHDTQACPHLWDLCAECGKYFLPSLTETRPFCSPRCYAWYQSGLGALDES